MSKFTSLNKEGRQEALLAAESKHASKLPAYIIEKDYWVSQTLRILYREIAPNLKGESDKPFLFKGGTSLSKGYNLINRMSEDIDLAFSLDILKCDPIDCEKITSRKARQEAALDIDKQAAQFVAKYLQSQLTEHFHKLDTSITIEIESHEPLNIAIYYPKALDDGSYGNAVRPRVLLETGGRSDNHPDEVRQIEHMLGQAIPELFDEKIDVLTLSAERTLLEKMFGIHTNNIKGSVADKHSRHLYDVVQIDSHYPDWCQNKDLFKIVVHFCDVYYKWHAESCASALSGPIFLVPKSEDLFAAYEKDWNSMADMFPNATLPYSFNDLIGKIRDIEERTNDGLYS
ncbi:nucleotidyl transferase AbiEii/AbiGii toxin family protein [Aeromonas jandaei]|uniref:nucleotidyl transferase AbiEii/AbiGii toxin family protein n=1 Tax=Aeromonas jandaei TaxID=650 RepID=UPI003F79E33D